MKGLKKKNIIKLIKFFLQMLKIKDGKHMIGRKILIFYLPTTPLFFI